MTDNQLRDAILAALVARGCNSHTLDEHGSDITAIELQKVAVLTAYGMTRTNSLRALAVAVGLRVTDDGVTDPAEESERLRAELDDMNNLVSCQRDALNDLARVIDERDEAVRSRDYSRDVIASDDTALRALRAEVAEYMERIDAIRRYVSSRDHGEGCPGEEYESDCECGLMQLRALVEVKP